MNWFFIALSGPIFWSVNTHFDKFILSKYEKKEKGVEAVFLFSTLFSIMFAIGLFTFKHSEIIPDSQFQNFGLLIIPGILNALGFYFYLQSLKTEESSVVVALFQMTPVFAYFLSYLILGEVLTNNQIFASILILIGASILSFSLEENRKIVIKKRVVGFITLSALFFAANDVLFKKLVHHGSFVTSLFWQHIGIFIIGTCFFIILKKHRAEFIERLKENHFKLFILNSFNEFFYVLGNLISNLATLFAPVALVLVVNTYQTVFTFVIGILLTLFLPHIITEKTSRRHLTQKILAIVVIIIGSYFLY